MAGSSIETFPTPSDGTYGVGNIKLEKDLDMQEEVEVNVKTEKDVGSEEEECIDIKGESDMHSEREKEEGLYMKEEEDVDVKEKVSCEKTKTFCEETV
jgi:hypothetical protein